jgi:uncharacterized protein (TIGR02001 family)
MNVSRRRRACGPIVSVLLCAGVAAPCHAEGSWAGTLTASTDYVLRGISQSNGEPALQGSLAYQWDTGWYTGAWASTLEREDGYYPAGTAESEIDLFFGVRTVFMTDWSATVQATHYVYPHDGDVVDYDYSELELAVSYRDVWRASVAWSPDASTLTQRQLTTDRDAWSYELSMQHVLVPWLGVSAGIGYRDLAGLDPGGYAYWSAGLSAQLRTLSLSLARIGTDADGRDLFGDDLAGDRTVVSLAWSF